MLPLRDENRSRRIPVVTIGLIAINAVAFMYELGLGPALRPFLLTWGLVPARLSLALHGEAAVGPAILSAFTSMFMHGGWAHLLGNLWYLWIFGDNVEDRFGPARFLLFYLAAGVASATLHVAIHPGSWVPTVGASGAIAGVLGAYLVLYPGARIHTLIPLFPFFQVVALPAVLVLGLWFVFQFFSGALALASTGAGGVAWWAHIGGFAFGMLVAAVTPRRRRAPERDA